MEEEGNRMTGIQERMKRAYAVLLTERYQAFIFIQAVVITVFSCVHYYLTMLSWTSPGFTLDDSWIHVQYARTIFEGNPWEYSTGSPSTGSTSPLWSILLSPLFLFSQTTPGVIYGVLIIATLLYSMSSFLIGMITFRFTENKMLVPIAIIGFVLMPRNTWLMLSGMETPILFTLVLLAILVLDYQGTRADIALGVISGLAFLARPEGVLIVLVCYPVRFLKIIYDREEVWKRLGSMLLSVVIAGLIVLPWVMYCLSVTGHPLPDTFYAKVHPPTEFEVEVWYIHWTALSVTMPAIIIGVVSGFVLMKKGKAYVFLLAASWFVLYRFTIPYQAMVNNIRYVVPIYLLFYLSAVVGFYFILRKVFKITLKEKAKEFDMTVLPVVFAALLLVVPSTVGYMQQAEHFGNSVKNINEQQVTIGKWLAENTPDDAVFAIHDAGAIRFFSGRPIIDLAGLVSPEIIHGNMTPPEILAYLRDNGCDYFVFFDELFMFWSFYLGTGYTKLYTVHLDDNVISGRDTMSVYHINWPQVQDLPECI